MTDSVVRARIDEHVKEEAAAVLKTIGLSLSDAFRLLLTRVAREKTLPFDPLVPNDETLAAAAEARRTGRDPDRPDALLNTLLNQENRQSRKKR